MARTTARASSWQGAIEAGASGRARETSARDGSGFVERLPDHAQQLLDSVGLLQERGTFERRHRLADVGGAVATAEDRLETRFLGLKTDCEIAARNTVRHHVVAQKQVDLVLMHAP